VNGKQKTPKVAATRNTPATPASKKIVAKAKDLEAKQNQSGKRALEEHSDPVVDLSVVDGAAATPTSIPASKPVTIADGGRSKRSKKDPVGENKSECSWKCQTLSMHQGLKCQAALTSSSATACRGTSFACQACSDHATGESVGSIVCYACADSDQTTRWYAARDGGKKHFLFGVTCDSLNNYSGFLAAK
jgi:hypothetical protein